MQIQKEKEELDDLTTELELADEDEKIPYGPRNRLSEHSNVANEPFRYKVGDSFFHMDLEKAQDMLETATERIEEEIEELENKLESIQDEMKELKVQLYARFGKQINLET